MAKPEAVFIYIGTYPDEASTRADYDVVKDLHAVGAVGTYDAAVVAKAIDLGKSTRTGRQGRPAGAWSRTEVALISILFPPAIIAATARPGHGGLRPRARQHRHPGGQ